MERMGFFFWQLWWLMPVFTFLWGCKNVNLHLCGASALICRKILCISRKIGSTLCFFFINNLWSVHASADFSFCWLQSQNFHWSKIFIDKVDQEYWYVIYWLWDTNYTTKFSFIRKIAGVLAEKDSEQEQNYTAKSERIWKIWFMRLCLYKELHRDKQGFEMTIWICKYLKLN